MYVQYVYMGVSKNRGTPKWMVYNGKTLLKFMIRRYPYSWKHPYMVFLFEYSFVEFLKVSKTHYLSDLHWHKIEACVYNLFPVHRNLSIYYIYIYLYLFTNCFNILSSRDM